MKSFLQDNSPLVLRYMPVSAPPLEKRCPLSSTTLNLTAYRQAERNSLFPSNTFTFQCGKQNPDGALIQSQRLSQNSRSCFKLPRFFGGLFCVCVGLQFFTENKKQNCRKKFCNLAVNNNDVIFYFRRDSCYVYSSGPCSPMEAPRTRGGGTCGIQGA